MPEYTPLKKLYQPNRKDNLEVDTTLSENFKIIDDEFGKVENEIKKTNASMNQLVIEGDSSVEAAQARLSIDGQVYGTLKERLDSEHQSTTAQLAEKASRADLSNVLDGSPKGTYATLADLQAAFPTGATGVYIVTADGHIYSWDETAWVDRGVYQAVGLADESVSPEHTTFIRLGKNMFDASKATANYTLAVDGSIQPFDGYHVGDFRAVKAGQPYTASNARNLALYDTNQVFVEGSYVSATSSTPTTITPTVDGFLRVSFPSQYLTYFQVEKGATKTDFEPYKVEYPELTGHLERRIEEIEAVTSQSKNLTIYKFGDDTKIRAPFTATSDLLVETKKASSANQLFNFNGTYLIPNNTIAERIIPTVLDGEYIHTATDDIAPIRTYYTVGANHGYFVAEITFAGKTAADIGSVWTDGTREWVIINVVGNIVSIIPNYIDNNGFISASTAVPPTVDLTHVSGATNTQTISIATKSTKQLYPSVNQVSRKYFGDGKEITSDGEYGFDKFEVRESYNILDYKSLYDMAKANIGVHYSAFLEQIQGVARMSINYDFKDNADCTIFHTLRALKKFVSGDTQLLQSQVLSLPNHTVYQYMPNVLPKGGYDFKTPTDMTAFSTSITFEAADFENPEIPPHRYVQWLRNGATKKAGFTMGYISDKGEGSNAKRKVNSPKAWNVRNTKKNYPYMLNSKAVAEGEYFNVVGYRNYLSPEKVKNATNITSVVVGAETYLYVDYHENAAFSYINVPELAGKKITVVEKNANFTLHNDFVDADGVLFSVTNGFGYGILMIS